MSQADLLSQISFLQSDLTRLGKNLGEAQVDESTSYGNRVDEAKRLIKQLEAYKSAALATAENAENNKENNESDDTVLIEKNDKGDVKYILLCKGLWIKKGIISYVIFNDLSLSNL